MGIEWVRIPNAKAQINLSFKDATVQQVLQAIVDGQPGADGRVLPLSLDGAAQRKLALSDAVFVRVSEGGGSKGKGGARAELRVRPVVQGSIVVLENKTGRILAMAGGFSYPLSQLNRVTQSVRQPGSAIKPLSYLAALRKGLQPNTLISDDSITLPPIGGGRAREQDYWSPKNYDGGGGGALTLRRALENSRNLATVHLLEGGIEGTPEASLDRLCKLALEAQIYRECMRYYPFVLGAQPVRPIDLAAFYGAIANEGKRPTPHVIEQIALDDRVIYKANEALKPIPGIDAAAVFQLRTILQGVVARGTAARLSPLSNVIAGKTGTSDDFNDAWFMGFSNDVTIGVWVGYDNAKGKKTLGSGQAGSRVALPIFDSIMKAVWADYAPQVALPGPSPEANRRLIALPIDVRSGARIETRNNRTAFQEYFRLDESGRLDESQYRLVSRGHEYSVGDDDENNSSGPPSNNSFFFEPFFSRNFEGASQSNTRHPDARRPSRNGFPAEQQEDRRSPFGFFGGRSGGF